MAKIKITKDRCKGCYLCIAQCPRGLIVVDEQLNKLGKKPARFKHKKDSPCTGCTMCCIVCPEVCIEALK
ncbi:4Fe-4S dicluster domain-containing protein [Candidatus Omnitrophota bacterium]